MKVVFLDIDGVLNYACCESRTPAGFIGVDPGCVRILHSIVDPASAVIVLISTWQNCWVNGVPDADGKYLIDELAKEGLEIYDMTGYYGDDRGFGIYEWLQKHRNVTHYVVLDDNVTVDFKHWDILPHHVQPNYWSGGLKREHVKPALDLLGVREVNML